MKRKLPDTKTILRKLRSIATFYVAEQTFDHLEAIRSFELAILIQMLPSDGRLLEIGSGSGWQAKALEENGFSVSGIDLATSKYKEKKVWPVVEYDGSNIPFEDNEFDIVFSSNVLEHIPHAREFQHEIHRVLKPAGCVMHVLPSSSWRCWTIITGLLKTIVPTSHGEQAGNAVTEIYYFSRHWWKKLFSDSGWAVETLSSNDLFYTGYSIMDSRLSLEIRRKLSCVLGSSCNVFILRKKNQRS